MNFSVRHKLIKSFLVGMLITIILVESVFAYSQPSNVSFSLILKTDSNRQTLMSKAVQKSDYAMFLNLATPDVITTNEVIKPTEEFDASDTSIEDLITKQTITPSITPEPTNDKPLIFVNKTTESNLSDIDSTRSVAFNVTFSKATNWAFSYYDTGAVSALYVLDMRAKTLDKFKRCVNVRERDRFKPYVFTTDLVSNNASDYIYIVEFKTKELQEKALRKKLAFELINYDKHTSAMRREDLYCWSKSYTDATKVKVVQNGEIYVNVAKYCKDLVAFCQVATELNRTHRVLDNRDIVILRKDIADRFIKANKYAMSKGYRICIYDGYRTQRNTGILYAYTLSDISKPYSEKEYKTMTSRNMSTYVVNPNNGIKLHGKGAAADITLVDMKTGEMVNMPTPVNTMNSSAWVVNCIKDKHYKILYDALRYAGLNSFAKEWYHISFDKRKSGIPNDSLVSMFY